MGHKAILLNEMVFAPNGNQVPSLDLNLDDKIMDIASITTSKKIGNVLMAKNRQIGNVKHQTGIRADSLCIYFHKEDSFSETQILNDIDWYKKFVVEVGSKQRIKHIYVVINNSTETKIYDI